MRFREEIQEVLRRGDGELDFGSDHADANRLALAFRVLQPRLLCAFLCLEGLRERRELPVDVLEEEPLFSDFGHWGFIARGCFVRVGADRGGSGDEVP